MPKPHDGETEDDFIDRCMGDDEAVTDFPDVDQRRAFCQSQWDEEEQSMAEKQTPERPVAVPAIVTSKSNTNDKPPERPGWLSVDQFDARFAIDKTTGGPDDEKAEMTFTGYASVFGGTVDSWMPTIIEQGAFKDSLARIKKEEEGYIAILWQHNWNEPIGQSSLLREDKKGLWLEAVLDPVEQAIRAHVQLVRKTIRKMSIGFESTAERFEKIDNLWHRIISKLDLWETSVVTFAADRNAWIAEAASRYGVRLDRNGRPVSAHEPIPAVDILSLRVPLWQTQKAVGELELSERERALFVDLGALVLPAEEKPEETQEHEDSVLGLQLTGLIEARVDETTSAGDLLVRMANRAEIALETLTDIIEGDRAKITIERVSAFAEALAADEQELLRAAKRDGLEVETEAPVEDRPTEAMSGLSESEKRLREAEMEAYEAEYGVKGEE